MKLATRYKCCRRPRTLSIMAARTSATVMVSGADRSTNRKLARIACQK